MATKIKKEDVWIPTACNMCFNACAIKVHKVDGVVVKIEGNPDSPVGQGRVCGKGASGIMQLYDPDRKTKPMKRTNPKKGFNEDPGWVEISWEEAYSLAAENMKKVMDKEPRGILGYGMVTNNANLLPFIYWIAGAIGGKYWCSDICGAAIHPIYDRFNGTGNAAPDYDLCKYVLQFGTQAGTATRHGFNMSVNRFAEAREKGCKLVSVDPYMAAGAQKADMWVPIRPGTDGALAMAIGYVLVHELDLYDKEYLKKYTNSCDLVDMETGLFVRHSETGKPYVWDAADNQTKTIDDQTIKEKTLRGTYTVDGKPCKPSFELYLEHVKQYTPEYAEQVTTVPAKTIRQIAKEFGEAACIGQTITINGQVFPYRPAAADCFSGVTRHKHAHLSVWAVLFLNLLIGSHNVPGGMISFSAISDGNPATGLPAWRPGTYEPDHMLEGNRLFYAAPKSSYKEAQKPVKFVEDYDLGLFSLQPLNLGGDAHFIYPTQLNPEPYKQKRAELLFCYAGNIVKNWGNHEEMADFLRTFNYVICCDIYLSDTTYFADLFLPEACYLERYDAPPNANFSHHTVGNLQTPWALSIRQPVVEAKDGAPTGMDIFLELADRLGKRPNYNGALNALFGLSGDNALEFTKKYVWTEVLDRVYKAWAGPDKGLEWFKKNGVLTWPRKLEEVYLYPFRDDRIPLYVEAPLIVKPQLEAELRKYGFEWEQLEDYQPLPGWKPCPEFEVTQPGYDLFPIYYTNALNVDTWGQTNPWIDEINDNEPYGYTIEINSATAAAKGLQSGDHVILQTAKGYEVEGRLMAVEGIHPEVLAASSGCWGNKSQYIATAKSKGVPINNLIPVRDTRYYDHLSAAYDQCVRVKVMKRA